MIILIDYTPSDLEYITTCPACGTDCHDAIGKDGVCLPCWFDIRSSDDE